MKNVLTKFFVLLVSAGLVSCASNNRNEYTTTNTSKGVGTEQVATSSGGAVIGTLIGGNIGHSMGSSDTVKTYAALETNPTYKLKHWTNKKTGHQYTIIPTSEKMAWNGQDVCRTYNATAIVKGKHHRSSGTACRQSDGTWKTVAINS
jgi:surface antigen